MPTVPLSGDNPKLSESNRITHELRRANCLAELRRYQVLAIQRAEKVECSNIEFAALTRVYCELRNAIRIEKGMIKPGSRNISVREESASVPAARITRQEMNEVAQELGLKVAK